MDYSYTYSSTAGEMDPALAGGIAAAMLGVMAVVFIVILLVYIFMAICLMKIAKKTNTENAWLAWIPIANIILMLQIAKKPMWWIILFFIPLVNVVMSVLVWMGIAEAVKKPSWLGILTIVPVANLIVPAYLAFSNGETPVAPVAPAV